MVKKRGKDTTVASGKNDAIIPHRRKGDGVTRRATIITLSRDGPVRGAPTLQHRNAVLHHTVLLYVSAPSGWGGRERGVVECIAYTRCTATVLKGRCMQRGLWPPSFTAEIDRAVLPWAKQMQRYGKW